MTNNSSNALEARRRALRWWPLFGLLFALVLAALVAWLAKATPLFDATTLSAALAGQLTETQAQWLAVLCPLFCFAWLITLAASWLISLANFMRDKKLLASL
jgi:hypothetical protein